MCERSENISLQCDELEALESIYGEEWFCIDKETREYGMIIADETRSQRITLEVKLSVDYPQSAPPMYDVQVAGISTEQRLQLDNRLIDIYLDKKGECVLFEWIMALKDYLLDEFPEKTNEVTEVTPETQVETSSKEFEWRDSDEACDSVENTDVQWTPPTPDSSQDSAVIQCPEIFHGEPLHDRKSKFQAHLAEVLYKEQVKMVLDKLCENRKIAAATHNIYAYRIYREEEGKRPLINQGCEDDGEIHAGNRMLHLLQIIDCQNVMVVVTRWYGGIHLGPDRFKHINSLTRNILEDNGYIKDLGKGKDKKSSKKK